jgi:3-deoxy-D-manno-octulosonic-acid transferase
MVRALYSLLTWLAQPLLRRKLARRAVAEPGYAVAVGERFGHYSVPADQGRVWIHAVSLGETRAAAILLERLRAQNPGLRLLLTNGTATGRAEGEKLLRPGDVQVWQPWDTPGAVARFLDQFQPRIGILMETEIWPNLTAACAPRGIPLVLANARLNAGSFVNAQRLGWLSRPAYGALAAVWAQTEGDAGRLRALGAPVKGVFGNLKFDATPDAAQLEQGRAWRAALGRPVVLFASSREGEESLFLKEIEAKSSVKWSESAINSEPSVKEGSIQWLLVPRHPQRFDEVAELIAQHGFAVSRRSSWGEAPPTELTATVLQKLDDGTPVTGRQRVRPTVWLGDSLGEMALYYGLSDVALLGGSFAPLGGQNLIEAAACGCPVIMGPHTFNFEQAAELSQACGAAQAVTDMAAAHRAARVLVSDPARQVPAAGAALSFAAAHRGAADRTAQAIQSLISRLA